MGELRFDDRAVVVTGGGRGIGRSHALAFAARGAKVVVADYGVDLDGNGSSPEPADEVVAEIEAAGGTAVAAFADVSDERGAASLIETALGRFGRIDVVVNNAGISEPTPFAELTTEQFERMIAVHYFGTLFTIRAAWPHFVDAGHGRIVNTMSESALGGLTHFTSYAAAKGAVWGLTRTLATEGVAHGIAVNAIAPRAWSRMAEKDAALIADILGQDPADREVMRSMMPVEWNSPGALYLAHESCPLTGHVLQVGAGGISCIAIVQTQGIPNGDASPEEIAAHIDAIVDVTGAKVASVEPYTPGT
jgi:NAD(P)-dependent dehydrogenase (short-subunit alcohol dehydrogenase family)